MRVSKAGFIINLDFIEKRKMPESSTFPEYYGRTRIAGEFIPQKKNGGNENLRNARKAWGEGNLREAEYGYRYYLWDLSKHRRQNIDPAILARMGTIYSEWGDFEAAGRYITSARQEAEGQQRLRSLPYIEALDARNIAKQDGREVAGIKEWLNEFFAKRKKLGEVVTLPETATTVETTDRTEEMVA